MPGRHAAAGLSLAAVLAATLVTLGAGAAVKTPCATGDWADGRQYRSLCYSDIVPLYSTEHLTGGRLPYLDACPADGGECDEYPVLTMYLMRTAAWIGQGAGRLAKGVSAFAAFFWANAILLAACGLATAWALRTVAGDRALFFAVAPTLLVYSFVNWDLLAVALATVATLAFVRRRDGPSGALLGLGAAAKFFPALLLIPFAAARLREGDRRGAARLAFWTVAAWAVVDLPFALAAPHAWGTFFRFNASRPVDWDSLWFVACQRLHGGIGCSWPARTVNLASIVAFMAVAAAVYALRRRRDPAFARWTFAFPLLVAFLLTNKVYSPQYGLWLLPWFALALPSPWLFAAFEAADVAVFVTRFTWFGRLANDLGQSGFAGFRGVPLGAFEVAVVVRAAVLVACLVAWTRGSPRREAARLPADRDETRLARAA